MPVTGCGNTTVLTGQDGMVAMIPPGTEACLKDHTDFPAPTGSATVSLIKIPSDSDFRVGDPISFVEQGQANLDTALAGGTRYYVKSRPTLDSITISLSNGGAGIALNGDGGAGGVDTDGAGNHIKISYYEPEAVCEAASVTLSLTRGQVDTTAIPCKPAQAGSKIGKFRRYQPGFIDGNGTLVLRLTPDNSAFTNRILQGSLFNRQEGAQLSAYFHAVSGVNGVDNSASQLAQFPITLLGFESGITPDEQATQVTINYRIADAPTELFGLAL